MLLTLSCSPFGWGCGSATRLKGSTVTWSQYFPGFGVAAARLLVEERGAVGLGVDTLGIDAGRAHDFPVHRHVSLPRGVWHLENLVDLHAVPAVGAWAVVGVPRVVGASGFPARVLALVPVARPGPPPRS